MFRQFFLAIAIPVLLPVSAYAGVVINEVAWMGTAEDANNEWIEIHNQGGADENVDGWTLGDGVSLLVTLQGVIPANSTVLLERTDDTSVPSVSAFQIYTGALSNDGRTLTLKRGEGTTEDQVIGGEGWVNIGGNNITKETPQRTGTGWVTGAPTPGAENVTEDTTSEEVTETPTNTTQSGGTKNSGGSSTKKVTTASRVSEKNVPPVLTLSIQGPKVAYVNQKVSFEVVPEGLGKTILNSLSYMWNFGDTYTESGKKVSHTFAYPGEYIVVVEGAFAKHRELARYEVKVLPVSFTIKETLHGDIELHNDASYEVDLGGFSLLGGIPFVFPKLTFLKAKGTLTVPKSRIGTASALSLHDGEGATVASYSSIQTEYVPQKVAVVARETSPKEVAVEDASNTPGALPTSTAIRIGNTDTEEKENRGLFARFFGRLAQLFGS